MTFTSYLFTLLILPLGVCGYFLANNFLNNKYGNVFIVLLSLFFYSYNNINSLLILIVNILINYFLYILIIKYRKKNILKIGVVINVLFLLYFKYLNFFISNIRTIFRCNINTVKLFLPLAISFYVFSQISFLVDCYKDETERYSFIEYCLYVLYFPKILQGPISSCKEIISQFRDEKKRIVSYDNILSGLYFFMFGMSEKIILADKLGNATEWAFRHLASFDTTNMIVVVLSYTFQIFFDFDGYSNMAVGISKMFNIELIDNFDSPYFAYNFPLFWKKWHISLTKFFTKYIYIPLGGNRKGITRMYVNTMIVFVLSGVWHGANWNFLIWGFLNGLFVCIGKQFNIYIDKVPKIISWLVTFLIINFLWMVFRTESINDFLVIIKTITSFKFGPLLSDLVSCYGISEIDFVPYDLNIIRMFKASRFYILIYFVMCTIVICFEQKIKQNILHNRLNIFIKATIILLFIYCILSFTSNYTFIYAGF